MLQTEEQHDQSHVMKEQGKWVSNTTRGGGKQDQCGKGGALASQGLGFHAK